MSLPRFQAGNPFSPEPAPSGHKGLKKGVYLVPSLFTALNILAGFFSLMETMTGFSLLGTGDATKHFDYAAMAIGWALLFDILDGRVARMTRSTTEIGIQLDSKTVGSMTSNWRSTVRSLRKLAEPAVARVGRGRSSSSL